MLLRLGAAQAPPLWTEMKKLAVGAENWPIDTLLGVLILAPPAADYSYPPPPKWGAHGLPRICAHPGRQQTETDIPTVSPPPAVRPPRLFPFTQFQIFFSLSKLEQ